MSKKRLPKDKNKRISVVQEFYKELDHLPNDKERLKIINDKVTPKITWRTFCRYKQEFEFIQKKIQEKKDEKERLKKKEVKGEPTNAIKKAFKDGGKSAIVTVIPEKKREPEEIEMPIVEKSDPDKTWSLEERKKIIHNIISFYEQGYYSLTQLLRVQDISVSLFLHWVNGDDYYYNLWEKAKERHRLHYLNLYEEGLKEHMMASIKDPYFEEITEIYDIDHQVGPDNTIQEIWTKKSARVVRRPVRWDSKTIELYYQIHKEMKASTKLSEEASMAQFQDMTIEQLDQEISRYEKLKKEYVAEEEVPGAEEVNDKNQNDDESSDIEEGR